MGVADNLFSLIAGNPIGFGLDCDRPLLFTVIDVDFNYDAYGPKYSNISPPFSYFCCYSPEKPRAYAIIYDIGEMSLRYIASRLPSESVLDAFRNYVKPYRNELRSSAANMRFSWNGTNVIGAESYGFVRLPLELSF